MITKLKERIMFTIRNNDTETAMKKLLGYMKYNYGDSFLCEQLANLYIKTDNFDKAGKYIFYKEELSSQDEKILTQYYQSFGHDKVVILRDLVGNCSCSPQAISPEVKFRLLTMMNDVQSEYSFLPKFMWNWHKHFCAVCDKEMYLESTKKSLDS